MPYTTFPCRRNIGKKIAAFSKVAEFRPTGNLSSRSFLKILAGIVFACHQETKKVC
jgi:hypothetical protein